MKGGKKGSGRTVPVTFRFPEDEASLLQRKAEAAFISRSAYIALRLGGEEPDQYPALAALARVVAIHETVRTKGGLTADQLAELRAVLSQFAKLARAEALR